MIGKESRRLESLEKTSGQIKYVNDYNDPSYLHGAVKTSPHAYAKIIAIHVENALAMPGVRKVVVGEDFPYNFGLYLGDKPPLARGVARHYGEAVAAVVADTVAQAKKAVQAIVVEYEILEPIRSAKESYETDVVLHPEMHTYNHIDPIHPEPGSNIANRTKIRKGDYSKALEEADCVIESWAFIPPGDHVAMEPRACVAQISKSGEVTVFSTTQAPFVVKSLLSVYFDLDVGKITVKAPPLGGGFGGKAGIQLEGLAYILSKSVGGRPVKLVNSREEDLVTSPGHIGLEARVKLAADKTGRILGADILYLFDSGAYADYAVNVSRASAISSSGPYNIPNLTCDSLCMYTNHPFATAYRGFGHIEMSYAMEKAMDVLAEELSIDPYEIRLINAIQQGDTTPTGSLMNENTGDLRTCLDAVAKSLDWDAGAFIEKDAQTLIVKGISCLWKAPAMPTNADAGAILTFNPDGSCNLSTGVVEIGQGTKTGLMQIAAEVLRVPPEMIHVTFDVDTRTTPSDWATAASRSLFMAGRATIDACEDALDQLLGTASIVLKAPKKELDYANGKVFMTENREESIHFSELGLGYTYPNGNAIVGQVIGVGRYISPNLTDIDQETGQGHPDLEWTLGAQGVIIEVERKTGMYKILKAVTAMDVGKVINPFLARGQTTGGMAMGIGYATSEGFLFNSREQVLNTKLRDFKIMRYHQAPEYEVIFIETPQKDGPFGARGLGEQSVIGMPGAIANALTRAVIGNLNHLPITAEKVWKEGVK
jgi:CO/xanthine dehydrogenase Mo-binding subunit